MSSIDGVRPFVEAAVVAEPLIHDDELERAAVIRVQPNVQDLSPIELIEQARPYLAAFFVLLAALVLGRLGLMLFRRYRAENFAAVAPEALDRQSVRRRRHAIKSEQPT